MKKIALILLYLLLISPLAYSFVPELGLDPLDQSSGARPFGMGGAYTADSGGINSLFYNPAGLTGANGITATIGNSKNFSAGVASKLGPGTFGLGVVYKGFDDFKVGTAEESYVDNMAVVGYGLSLGYFSFGFTLKDLITQNLSSKDVPDLTSKPFSDMDFGIIMKPLSYLSLGVVIHNALNSQYSIGDTDEAAPKSSRAGVLLDLVGDGSLFQNDTYGLKLAYDSESKTIADESRLNSYYGAEVSYANWIFIRGGGGSIFKIDDNISTSSFGLGFKLGDVRLDLASILDPITESQISYFSINYYSMKFGVFEQAAPAGEAAPAPVKIELLKVSSPEDDMTTYGDTVAVEGQTDPKAELKINGVNAYIGPDGKFKAIQSLMMGKNLIEIDARHEGDIKIINRKVFRRAKVVIAEEAGIEQQLKIEVFDRAAEISKQREILEKQKAKGVNVTAKIQKLDEEQGNIDARKQELLDEKKKMDDRKEKVENLVTLGVIEVSPQKNFEVEAPIRRGEMISWLVKASGIPIPKVTGSVFQDVPMDNEYAPFINAAVEKGLIKATADNRFRPNDPVTEAEAQEFFSAFGVIR